ncbi:hypothetical protein F2Q69_00041804 [Brassica cretica]|uniref:Uncharacterized protein n=1 Tax=Brassica cretica TaxID=69181 RepID=A0A8S9NDJ3_BRACR|nr:hypothetical protein F2Q69_00041804 [Brassica cretica]
MRKGNVDVAVKLIKDKMAGFGVTLTDAEAKRMAGLSSGTFVVEAYDRYVEAKEKATPKTPPKVVVGKSKKSDKKQKIPPVTAKKKETAAVGGWWGRRRWMNIGGGGWWSRRSWMNAGGGGSGERGGVKKLTPIPEIVTESSNEPLTVGSA